MVIGKIKPTATIVAQFPASVEVEAIMHEGKVFMPVMSLGEFSPKEVAPTSAKSEKSAPAAPSKKEPVADEPEEDEEETAAYTEKELMDMETKELEKILKDDFDVNPDDYPGKNTNKKLRKLILDAQENEPEETPVEAAPKKTKASKPAKVEEPEDEEPEDESPEDEEETLQSSVAAMLEDFDGGKMNKKKTVSRIAALAEGTDADEVLAAIEEFEDNADADIDDTAEAIVAILEGKTKKKKSEKKPAAKKSKETLVEPEDLEVGQKVSVYWEDQEEWYDGEVKSIKKGKVKISYEDGTEELLDENNTKIKLL